MSARGRYYRPLPNHEPSAAADAAARQITSDGSRRLHDATMAMYRRHAIIQHAELPGLTTRERTVAVAVFMQGTLDAAEIAA